MSSVSFPQTPGFVYTSTKTGAPHTLYDWSAIFGEGRIVHAVKGLVAKGGNSRVKRGMLGSELVARRVCSLNTARDISRFEDLVAVVDRLKGCKTIMPHLFTAMYYGGLNTGKGVIIMPLADFDLWNMVQKHRIDDPSKKQVLATQLLEGLQMIHDLDGGGAHCDITPGNLLIKNEQLLISDLEYYRHPKELGPHLKGTQSWAAPETYRQFFTNKHRLFIPPIDTNKLDSWSAGLALYSIFRNSFDHLKVFPWFTSKTSLSDVQRSDLSHHQEEIDHHLSTAKAKGDLSEEHYILLSHMLKVNAKERWTITQARCYFLNGSLEDQEYRKKALLKAIEEDQEHRKKALLKAIEVGHMDKVTELLVTLGIPKTNFLGEAVRCAAHNNQLEIVNVLLRHGTLSDQDRGLAVKAASRQGHLTIIQALLSHGKISDEDRGFSVRTASREGYVEIVQALLDSGEISDMDRALAGNMALLRNHLEIAAKLNKP